MTAAEEAVVNAALAWYEAEENPAFPQAEHDAANALLILEGACARLRIERRHA